MNRHTLARHIFSEGTIPGLLGDRSELPGNGLYPCSNCRESCVENPVCAYGLPGGCDVFGFLGYTPRSTLGPRGRIYAEMLQSADGLQSDPSQNQSPSPCVPCNRNSYIPSLAGSRGFGTIADARTFLSDAANYMSANPSDPFDAAGAARAAADEAVRLVPNDPQVIAAAGTAYVYVGSSQSRVQNGQDGGPDATNAIIYATTAVNRAAQVLNPPPPPPVPQPAGTCPAGQTYDPVSKTCVPNAPTNVSTTATTNWTPWIIAGVVAAAGAAAVIGLKKYNQGGGARENPLRPPKKWWDDCTTGVAMSARKYGRTTDPKRVCGATWARKTDAQKRAKSREFEKR